MGLLLLVSVCVNLGLLFTFKYFDFFAGTVLPRWGISQYTAVTAGRKRRNAPELKFIPPPPG